MKYLYFKNYSVTIKKHNTTWKKIASLKKKGGDNLDYLYVSSFLKLN